VVLTEKKAKRARRAQREILKQAEVLRSNGMSASEAAATAMANVLGVTKQEATEFIQKHTKELAK